MLEAGIYVAVFRLAQVCRLEIGCLGRWALPAGDYAYVGSAQRNLAARVARHARRQKPLRWHIDYLSVHAPLVGALLLPGGKSLECRVAAVLARCYPRPIAGFGASDCRCGGHLFRVRGVGALPPRRPLPAKPAAAILCAEACGRSRPWRCS